MSGDSHPNDDSDFLDEDFVVEDLGGKNDDLEDLFDAPAAKRDASSDEEDAEPDADDVLFQDHTRGLEESERFEGREAFSEDGDGRWEGEQIDLAEEVMSDDAVGDEEGSGDAEPELAQAKESFTHELDSMLAEEDFAIDSEDELELIDAPTASEDGISEFEQSGPFVLDDGDGLWADDDALGDDEAAEEPVTEDSPEPAFAEATLSNDEALDAVDLPLRDAARTGAHGDEGADWEPLPTTSVDALSDVDEVQRTDDDYEVGYADDEIYSEEAEGAPVVAFAPPPKDLEDVDGHDIYAEDEDDDEAVVVGGPVARRSRAWGALLTLAATLVLMGGAAAVVARPQWFGLRFEPERVERVEVARPRIEVAVVEPPKVEEASSEEPVQPQPVEPQPVAPQPVAPQPVAPQTVEAQPAEPGGQVGMADPDTANPTAPAGDPPVEQAVDPVAIEQPPQTAPTVQPEAQTTPVAVSEPQPDVAPPSGDALPLPIAQAQGPAAAADGARGSQLQRFGDGLMVGDRTDGGARQGQPVDGVLPGSRAFAQLANGNYFIGSVKHVADRSITLRVETGEVTLATEDIVQLTQLGSNDYEELQKATKGFVRLTNNNRLVGGILSKIADDHVVLEFRKNRVMLPKSVIGEIVSSGEEDGNNVRLDTTREEDSWLRQIAERELGTGRGAEVEEQPLPTTGRSGPPR